MLLDLLAQNENNRMAFEYLMAYQQFPLKRLTDGRGSKDCN